MPKKYTCGSIIPSSCVPYTGKDLKFLALNDQPACDANINEVFDKIGNEIFDINTAIDVTNFNVFCLTGLPSTKTIVNITQANTEKICGIEAQLQALSSQFADLSIGSEQITLNLGCLAAAAAPCQVSTNTYSLVSVLTLLVNEICAIKTELGI